VNWMACIGIHTLLHVDMKTYRQNPRHAVFIFEVLKVSQRFGTGQRLSAPYRAVFERVTMEIDVQSPSLKPAGDRISAAHHERITTLAS
jgi:hypothetical protein